MALFDSFTRRPKLRAAVAKAAKARKHEGQEADRLFQEACQGFAAVVRGDELLSEALYQWGFALFQQARTKAGAEADQLYQDAGAKFDFSLLAHPYHLGAAIDWGVALMEQARAKGSRPLDPLYDQAAEKFQRANTIQTGSASYNLACIHALRGEFDLCRAALEQSRDRGSLPAAEAMLEDPDLAAARQQDWFAAFLDTLKAPAEPVTEPEGGQEVAEQPETPQEPPGAGDDSKAPAVSAEAEEATAGAASEIADTSPEQAPEAAAAEAAGPPAATEEKTAGVVADAAATAGTGEGKPPAA